MNCWGSEPALHSASQALCICGSNRVQGFYYCAQEISLSFVWGLYLQFISLSCSALASAQSLEYVLYLQLPWCSMHLIGTHLISSRFRPCCTYLLTESLRGCWKHFALGCREVWEGNIAGERSKAVICSDIQISALTWMDQTFMQCRAHLWVQAAEIL